MVEGHKVNNYAEMNVTIKEKIDALLLLALIAHCQDLKRSLK